PGVSWSTGQTSLRADVVVVHGVVRQRVHHAALEPRFGEQLAGDLFAPGGAEALAAGGQRDGHAVHAGDRIDERRHRVRRVLVQVAGDADVLHQVHAVGAQRVVDVAQYRARRRLI